MSSHCSTPVKNTLFRAYGIPMNVCQLWAYRILHYIANSESVRPHQVTYFVRTFDAFIRNHLHALVQ